jgi:Tat protein secretion system quality control protein TatD with DNase activity
MSLRPLFDSHAHLAAPELFDEAAACLERARASGVEGVLAVGAGYGLSLKGMERSGRARDRRLAGP